MFRHLKIVFSIFLPFLIVPHSLGNERPGFSGGADYEAKNLDAMVQISCHEKGHTELVHFRCQDWVLNPAEFTYFLGPLGVQADHLIVESIRADRSSETKKMTYDSVKGRTSRRINLWVTTLTQRPLLKIGTNQIEWALYARGAEVAHGNFRSEVSSGPNLSCPLGRYVSYDLNDCRSPGNICRQHFERHNYCQATPTAIK